MAHSFHACETDVTKATFKDDIFERKKYADNLTKLVKNTTCPYVIALSSPWGTGKTFFLNAWRNEITWQKGSTQDEGKIPCAYFSAWEAENEADPLVSLVASIHKGLVDSALVSQEKNQTLSVHGMKTIMNPKTMLGCATRIVKGLANHYTENALDDIASDVAEKMGEDYFEQLANSQQDKIDFSKELKKTIDAVKEKTDTPILVMIDELDRCKPDYVILLLERIKHLFQVPGLIFVIAIDKDQLLSIVEHTFGIKEEQRNIYLEKFIDIYYELPDPNIMEYASNLILSHIDEVQNFNTTLQDEDNRRVQHEGNLSLDTFKAQYLNLNIFQRVLLGCIERFSLKGSVRGFEKKFYKFKTINDIYRPPFLLSVILFYIIITDCTVKDLFSGKRIDDAKTNEKKMYFAIFSYIILNISSPNKQFIKSKNEDFSYEINGNGDSAYTRIGILYKEITDYVPDQYDRDQNYINQYHQEGLTALRNQLQEMLDFGKNIEKA